MDSDVIQKSTTNTAAISKDWAEGYETSLPYISGVCQHMSPQNLALVMELNGLRPPSTDKPFTYLELGCGNGLASNLFAAANPHASFYAHDFMPEHITAAQRLADEAGVQNMHFLERSFEEMLDEDIPPCDFITLHGVYSWVSDAHRQQINRLIDKRLKPGGVVYVSYNALPGQAIFAPLRQVMVEHAARSNGGMEQRIPEAVRFMQRFREIGCEFLNGVPGLVAEMDQMQKKPVNYLQHEYFNQEWHSFYHTEVVNALKSAKLSFAGTGELINNFKRFILSPKAYEFYKEATDRSMGELIEDYARNKVFRRDVFHRGAEPFTKAEHDSFSKEQRFCLKQPRKQGDNEFEVKVSGGTIRLDAGIYGPILDAVGDAPRSLQEIHSSHASLRDMQLSLLRQYAFALCALDFLQPALPEAGLDKRYYATDRFNRAVLKRNSQGTCLKNLASPITGESVGVDALTQLFLLGLQQDVNNLASFTRETMQAANVTLENNGVRLTDSAQIDQEIQARVQQFYTRDLPFFAQLGVV